MAFRFGCSLRPSFFESLSPVLICEGATGCAKLSRIRGFRHGKGLRRKRQFCLCGEGRNNRTLVGINHHRFGPLVFGVDSDSGKDGARRREAADKFHYAAAKFADARRADVEAAVKLMKADASEAEARLQNLKAGNESWSLLSAALAESRQAFDQANQAACVAFKGVREICMSGCVSSEGRHGQETNQPG